MTAMSQPYTCSAGHINRKPSKCKGFRHGCATVTLAVWQGGPDMTTDAIVQGLVEAFEAGDAAPIPPPLAPGAPTWDNHHNPDTESAEGFAHLAIPRPTGHG